MTRREYELTDKQFAAFVIAINNARNTPAMMIGGTLPSSPQDVAYREWANLGKEIGFEPMTVKPVRGKGERFFTAVPVEQPIPGRTRINIVFDGPPGPEAGRFVEAEDAFGKSIKCGEWLQEGDKWVLAIGGAP